VLRLFGKTLACEISLAGHGNHSFVQRGFGLDHPAPGTECDGSRGLFLVGWVFSPTIAAASASPDRQAEVDLTPAQEKKLRLLARSTWLYFEHFVGPEDRWLPPDHYQEYPRGRIQHQTSPTNIGLMLLSTLAAHDLGYMGAQELSLRLRASFDTLESMERLRGHFSIGMTPAVLRLFYLATFQRWTAETWLPVCSRSNTMPGPAGLTHRTVAGTRRYDGDAAVVLRDQVLANLHLTLES